MERVCSPTSILMSLLGTDRRALTKVIESDRVATIPRDSANIESMMAIRYFVRLLSALNWLIWSRRVS